MQFITLLDYLLLPFYLMVIYVVAANIRNKYYPKGHPWRKYFLPGLSVKIIGALLIDIIYQYYYGGGDTSAYYFQARVVNEAISANPTKGFLLLFHLPDLYDPNYQVYISRIEWYFGPNMYVVIAVTAFLNLFTFQSFLLTSVLFACISYTGTWAFFRTFARQYPDLLRQVAIALLFVPSCFIWGSGIFKDTLCIFGLGWLTLGIFEILVRGNVRAGNAFMLLISFWMIAVIKIYILMAFIPAVMLWVVFTYSDRVRSKALKFVLKIMLASVAVFGIYYAVNTFQSELGGYSLDNIAKTAETTRSYVLEESVKNDGSGYDLGEINMTLPGMVQLFPRALLTALYGPLPWQSKKIIVFLNSVEAFIFLILTLKIIRVVGIPRMYKTIVSDANIQFFLVFTVIFAFAVGLTSGNYGSLSRYRIPCLPTFALMLFLIYYRSGKAKKPLFPLLKI